MNINPIKIDIEDDWKYGLVVFLVDRNDFLEDIQAIREHLKLKDLVPYQEVGKWKNRDLPKSGTSISYADEKTAAALTRELYLNSTILELKHKYHKGFNFTEVIEYAILSGVVTDREFNTSAFCVTYPFPEGFEDMEYYTEEPMVAILVNPETRLKEVKTLLHTDVRHLFKHMEEARNKVPKERENIKRDRDWYWKHENGLSYQKIWDQIPNQYKPESKQAVINAIKRYGKHLTIPI